MINTEIIPVNHIRDFADLLDPGRDIILCDSNTAEHCVAPLLKEVPQLRYISFEAGEQNKTLKTCEEVYSKLIAFGADRTSRLICVGGGVVCDMGAFIASTYMRGIDFISVPTSLLAMVDAAIGGKCGVDFMDYKNYIGFINNNVHLFLYLGFLSTLPQREWLNGRAEMLKHGLIASKSHYISLLENLKIAENKISLQLITDSIEIKNSFVVNDPYERGERKKLNFGHTIGHAIESAALAEGKALDHGLAVGVGMIAETYLSVLSNNLDKDIANSIYLNLENYNSEAVSQISDFNTLWTFMQKDKKNRNGKLMFTLLNDIGSAKHNCEVEEEQIRRAVEFIANG
ncbi:3-dehydroquinate synthase [bacterium]|nr:3-dehydroquinate synthase [bacterium]